MKARGEVISQPTIGDLEARIAKLEALVEQHHPTPRIEMLQPYEIDSLVYSISDLAANYPMRVIGYDLAGRILILTPPDDPCPRSLPLESVRPLKQCPRAQPGPKEAFAGIADDKARAYFSNRRAAQVEAATRPFVAPLPVQRRYLDGH